MTNKTTMDLRHHLFLFEPEYPIRKGYVARLFLYLTHAEVFQEVKTVVQTAEPTKDLNQENLFENLHRFKEIFEHKLSTCEWPSLIRFFLEPFPIAFSNFPILLDHLQPILRSDPAHSNSPENPEPLCPPPTPVAQSEASETSFTPPGEASTPVNLFFTSQFPRLPLPGMYETDCETYAVRQQENSVELGESSQLNTQLDVLNRPVYESEERWKSSLRKVQGLLKKKAKSAYMWKGKYATLKKTTRTVRRKWKMLQILEEKISVLEDELCKAQAEIERLNEIIKQLKSKLQKARK
ncbi:hypothetical protein BsWGS_05206 [Bradybaena similaris]